MPRIVRHLVTVMVRVTPPNCVCNFMCIKKKKKKKKKVAVYVLLLF